MAFSSTCHRGNLEKLLYFANYIVTDVHEESRKDMLGASTWTRTERRDKAAR